MKILALGIGLFDFDRPFGEARAADRLQVIEAADQTMLGAIEIRQGVEGAEFSILRPLSVGHVQHGETIVRMRNRCGHATVHAAARKHHGQRFFARDWTVFSFPFAASHSSTFEGELPSAFCLLRLLAPQHPR